MKPLDLLPQFLSNATAGRMKSSTTAMAAVAMAFSSQLHALSFDLGDGDWQLDLDTIVSLSLIHI